MEPSMLKVVTAAIALVFVLGAPAEAKQKSRKPVQPLVVSSAERAKIYADVLARCRKQHGATLVERVQLDLVHRRYTCWIH
jgi:hypothetical protein